jgi:hypothetical protein
LQLLRKQLSKHVLAVYFSLAVANRYILTDRTAIIVQSVRGDDRAFLGDGGVYLSGKSIRPSSVVGNIGSKVA